ncbi:hypothetical protein RJ639_001070 [Escallonia herrerae]|uniref:ABC transmembrane type-1 domain-containing protein n=1 Tax=Escallonia herrerae TaxID=1293975 RepID=A0AA89BN56_9ASTE|nr:hypothetical protein RJ639_001070 [Escallonia herrerae]
MTNLRRALYSAVQHNELAWFEKPENSVGLLTSRIINETSTVKTIISDRMSVIVQCISSILVATTLSMVVNWRMGLVAWAAMPYHFIAGLIQAKSAKGFLGDSAAAHSELLALASESATNIKTIASFCHEEHILEKARLSLQKPLRKSRKESVKYRIIQVINSDAMIVMDKGKVVEMGTHSTLIAASEGVYSRFFQLQSMTEK